MPSHIDNALDWLDRAEQAREVAGQLTDPGAKHAVLQLAESFERLARTAVDRASAQQHEEAVQVDGISRGGGAFWRR
jgi:hypothetical protein